MHRVNRSGGHRAILLVSLLLAAGGLDRSTCRAATGGEGRGLWVVRTSLLSRGNIDRLVESASRAGFNTLFVQVCGRGDAYFPSRVYPPAENCRDLLETGFDPLAYVIVKAHEKGLAVHAWVNTFLIWSSARPPLDPTHLLNRHPEWMMVDERGISMARYSQATLLKLQATGVFLSPSNREAAGQIAEFILDLVRRYPLDGLHLDYFRYPLATTDFSPSAREGFRNKSGIDPLTLVRNDDRISLELGRAAKKEIAAGWLAYRAEVITEFLRRLSERLNAVKPGLVRSAAVKPEISEAYSAYGQDWPRWVREGLLDLVLPMAYSTNPDVVFRQISSACREVGAKHVWAGLRAYDVPVSGIIERAARLAPLTPGGYCFFSYDGVRNNPLFFERVKRNLFKQ